LFTFAFGYIILIITKGKEIKMRIDLCDLEMSVGELIAYLKDFDKNDKNDKIVLKEGPVFYAIDGRKCETQSYFEIEKSK
jgi:hypothetical protein